jgi:purine-cytosine permease-like protein
MGFLADIPQWALWALIAYAVVGLFAVMSTADDSEKFAILLGDVFKIFLLLCIAEYVFRTSESVKAIESLLTMPLVR